MAQYTKFIPNVGNVVFETTRLKEYPLKGWLVANPKVKHLDKSERDIISMIVNDTESTFVIDPYILCEEDGTPILNGAGDDYLERIMLTPSGATEENANLRENGVRRRYMIDKV